MSYEPRGKVKVLMDRMAPNPGIALPVQECAQIMGVPQSALPAYFDAPVRHGAIFPITIAQRRYYGITRDAKPRAEPMAEAAARETTATGWTPPQMVPPRGTPAPTPSPAGSHGTVDGLPPGAARIYPDEPREDAVAKMAVAGAAREPAPRPPQAAPVLADASIPEAAGAATEQEEAPAQEPEPVTWNVWEDGDLDLHNLIELEGGGYRLPAEAVRRLRKFIAWLPA